ncbi:DUF2384 domain-containing protein [Acidithiobacillus sp. HP-6]|uniref:type II RES/Xre toxin-antitoxin system antitoxin n=1 Tax=unclassified Acidithiobacillus TaxID=2614800 RepID=UPI00187A5A8F|nr:MULTISPECIES: antitoxin Xre-like helix-turn-helix domain-containing protein [unclassified Acidithiobacillus]MBE7563715.1 DUF2384 domain-containing protein [Acidithiobacillus sp. HP-6]MBE7569484.1 DUF2384 domain-containing protein [Acidithiobacillus sp. HP-2]
MLNTTLMGLAPESAVNPLELAARIEAGLPNSALTAIKATLGLTDYELAALLDLSPRTLHRLSKQPSGQLSLSVGDRLYRLARVLEQAEETFSDSDRIRCWLREPQFGLGGELPLHLLRTEVGSQAVQDLLGRIAYGVYS